VCVGCSLLLGHSAWTTGVFCAVSERGLEVLVLLRLWCAKRAHLQLFCSTDSSGVHRAPLLLWLDACEKDPMDLRGRACHWRGLAYQLYLPFFLPPFHLPFFLPPFLLPSYTSRLLRRLQRASDAFFCVSLSRMCLCVSVCLCVFLVVRALVRQQVIKTMKPT